MIEPLSEKVRDFILLFSTAVTWQHALHLWVSNCLDTGDLPEKIIVTSYSPTKMPKQNEGKFSSHGWDDVHKALNWTKILKFFLSIPKAVLKACKL